MKSVGIHLILEAAFVIGSSDLDQKIKIKSIKQVVKGLNSLVEEEDSNELAPLQNLAGVIY
jgi:hypothetical protein